MPTATERFVSVWNYEEVPGTVKEVRQMFHDIRNLSVLGLKRD